MPFELTNLTQSIVNVPFNKTDARPSYILLPGASVVIQDEYIAQLDEDTRDRFLSVTSGPHPIFKVVQVEVVAPSVGKQGKGRSSSRKCEKQDEPSPIPDTVS